MRVKVRRGGVREREGVRVRWSERESEATCRAIRVPRKEEDGRQGGKGEYEGRAR